MTDPKLPRKFIRLVVQMEDIGNNRAKLINCREVVEALRLQCEGICVMKQEEITVTNFEALDSPKVTLPNEPQQH
jgi:hypothetical protein